MNSKPTPFSLRFIVLALNMVAIGAHAQAPPNPIMFVTQVPHLREFSVTAVFGNHLAEPAAAPRGGDLWIRYTNGTLKNITATAGFGVASEFQGLSGIAVRDPAMHWEGKKAVFSMLVGGPGVQYQSPYPGRWQLYEVTGLGATETPVITLVPNQPTQYNNVSPCYGTNDRLIFTSDRPITGQAHLHPQLDEYEESPTNTGLWSMDPATGDLFLMQHMPSGSFTPIVDSFGRVIYTRWDHLIRDQQADDDNEAVLAMTALTYGTFNYTNESATATAQFGNRTEVFPEKRQEEGNVEGLAFNFFLPWMIQEDGHEEETLNHLGRHELLNYFARSFTDDPNIDHFYNPGTSANPNRIVSCLQMKEDPTTPGRYIATEAQEFGTHASGRLFTINAAPSVNPEDTVINWLTNPNTADTDPANNPTGHFRDPLPMSNGGLVAAHTTDAREEVKDGPTLYDFRLRQMTFTGGYWVPGPFLTTGFSKTVSWWSPDAYVTFSGALWELQPIEVRAQRRPARHCTQVPSEEAAAFAQAGVPVAAMKRWLRENNSALVVVRDATTRDRADKQQPYNLRVPGGVESIGSSGKLYDVGHLQFYQADMIRGTRMRTPEETPREGRRALAQPMHSTSAEMLPNPTGPAGSVKLGLDGSAAAFVPARRAMSWQLTDPAGTPVVRERFWVSFQAGEIRSCTSCHGLNRRDQANATTPNNVPAALLELLAYWKTQHPTESLADPYQAWASGLTDTAPTADPDGNGRANLIDYALPLVPVLTTPGQANFSFARRVTATDVNYTVQTSLDLLNWSDMAQYGPNGDSVTPSIATEVGRSTNAGVQTITLSPLLPMHQTKRQFFRVKVQP
jgi:Hydrazine synthase alpha subunit middle domain